MSIRSAEELLLYVAEHELPGEPKGLFGTVYAIDRPDKISNGIAFVPGNKKRHWVLMTQEEYAKLSAVSASLKAMPERVARLFPAPDRLEKDGPVRRIRYDFRRPAFISLEGTVCTPWQSFVLLREWLAGRHGRHGGSASNAIVRALRKTSDTPPAPRPPAPKPRAATPASANQPPDITKAREAIRRLGDFYEVELLDDLSELPSAKEVQEFGVQINAQEDGLPEDLETLWIIEEAGFFSVICGPAFGLEIERKLRGSLLKFSMPSITFSELRLSKSAAAQLKKQDPLGSGWCLLRSHGGKVVGTLTSLRRFCQQIGFR